MKIEEILAELDAINQLDFKIESRMRDGAMPVKDLDGVELTEEAIRERTLMLARQLTERYPDEHPLLVSVLDGAMPFAADLHQALSQLNYPFHFSSIVASSYGASMSSMGCEVFVGAMPKIAVTGRTVIIIDEVFDTGKTCAALREKFYEAGARKTAVVVLVDKKQPRPLFGDPELAGFQIDPRSFIVGKGLDYDGMLRNEPWIRAVDLSTLPTPEEQSVRGRKKELINAFHMLKRSEPAATRASSSPRSPLSNSAESLSPRSLSAAASPPNSFFSSTALPCPSDLTRGVLHGPRFTTQRLPS